MRESGAGLRLYGDLARWWPLISPVEDYAEEATEAAAILGTAERPVRTVLELGSGGGHNAAHLKRRFALTLTDRSEPMLALSRRLNPECEHRLGDMRTLRLGRTFDAVFIHDAVDYLTSEADLAAAMNTAFVHCAAGGLALFLPDHTREGFEPSTEHGGADGPGGEGVRYLEWSYDPDPEDSVITTEYVVVLRERGKPVEVVAETHVTGLFPKATWLRLLSQAGFDAEAQQERSVEDRASRWMFLGRRPAISGS
jgi:trans-aconitate methyltransferase